MITLITTIVKSGQLLSQINRRALPCINKFWHNRPNFTLDSGTEEGMATSMEKIFGKDAFKVEQAIPGTIDGHAEKVRYVSYEVGQDVGVIFTKVTTHVAPPIPAAGGVVLDKCRLKSPDGMQFFCARYHGDVTGWQKQIEGGAKQLGLVVAVVEHKMLMLSDGRKFALNECEGSF